MFATRSLILCSAIAMAAAAPAFAADQPGATSTTRTERMDAALKDFESGKAAMTVPMPAAASSSHGMKKPAHAK